MSHVLVVEDNKTLASIYKDKIESGLGFKVVVSQSYSDTVKLLSNKECDFFVGVLDLNLPDAPNGEVVDLVVSQGIPSIVVTGDYSDKVRERVWSKGIIDYVLKKGYHNFDYMVSLIKRIHRNRSIKVLVVDDSKFARKYLCDLLEVHQYKVVEAADGKKALRVLELNPDIKMIITDFNMPDMDGFELTTNIRAKYHRDEKIIIGMSSEEKSVLSAKFIKAGANDFFNKPFLAEEFYCRISQNISMIENLETIKESEKKFRELADLLPQPVYEIDMNGKFTFLNKSGFELSGYNIEDLKRGLFAHQMFQKDDKEKLLKNISRILEGKEYKAAEYRGRRKDGSTVPVSTTSAPIMKEGKTVGLRGIIFDLTERKKAEEERVHKEKLQGVFELAGAACHELNQPLQVVAGTIELIKSLIPNDEKLTSSFATLAEHVGKMGDITRKLQNITIYETKDYLEGKIIDIDKASRLDEE